MKTKNKIWLSIYRNINHSVLLYDMTSDTRFTVSFLVNFYQRFFTY